MKGKFYGVGVGPGDPELLTLKAQRVLREVDVVCYPQSRAEKESVALSIVEPFLTDKQERVEIPMPMTKNRTVLEQEWVKGAETILAFLHAGRDVAFITLGDSVFYSTYSYLMRRVRELDPEIKIETIPGVTSFSCAAARMNFPLAEGEERLAVIPVLQEPEQLPAILETFENAVLLKVAPRYNEIVDVLEEAGMKEKAVYASNCGRKNEYYQRYLDAMRDLERDYLSLIIVKRGGCQ